MKQTSRNIELNILTPEKRWKRPKEKGVERNKPKSTTPIRRSAAIVLSRYNSSSTNFRDGQEDIGNTVLDETFVPRREGTITRKQKLGGMISYYERDAA